MKKTEGTRQYQSPERRILDWFNGISDDLFAAAIIIFMMMTCKHPFYRFEPVEYDQERIKAKKDYQLPWEGKNGKNWKFSPEFKDLFKKMVALNPENRLSIDEILAHEWFKGSTSRKTKVQETFDKLHELIKEKKAILKTAQQDCKEKRKCKALRK